MNKIELAGVTYVYGEGTPFEKKALDSVSLGITENCITGLMGHTGCGKSTLVQLLNGLLRPTEGKVLLDGADIWEKPKEITSVRFRVGLVFQYPEYQLFEETVEKDISFGPRNMGLSEEEIRARALEAARFVGIDEEMMTSSPFELSGGQKRRVAIAGVMAMDPEILILDEPAAGLDPKGRADILGGIRAYQRSKNKTVLIVSHSMEDMAKYSDELVVMKSGGILMKGSVKEVFSRSDELSMVGLDIPQITSFMHLLADRGYPVDRSVYTVEDAKAEILRAAAARKGGSGAC